MSIKYKFECKPCDLEVYFDVKINTKKFTCPECRERTLRIAAYRREGDLPLFELIQQIDALTKRFDRLDRIIGEDALDQHLVS